jgi:hypothetical protein
MKTCIICQRPKPPASKNFNGRLLCAECKAEMENRCVCGSRRPKENGAVVCAACGKKLNEEKK